MKFGDRGSRNGELAFEFTDTCTKGSELCVALGARSVQVLELAITGRLGAVDSVSPLRQYLGRAILLVIFRTESSSASNCSRL